MHNIIIFNSIIRSNTCFLDNMKNANVFRQCLMIYIHRKRPDIKIELEDIDIQKQGIHLNKKNKE